MTQTALRIFELHSPFSAATSMFPMSPLPLERRVAAVSAAVDAVVQTIPAKFYIPQVGCHCGATNVHCVLTRLGLTDHFALCGFWIVLCSLLA